MSRVIVIRRAPDWNISLTLRYRQTAAIKINGGGSLKSPKPQFTFKVADSEDCDVTCCGVPVWVGLPPQPANTTRSIHPDMTSRNRRPSFLRLPLAQTKATGTPRKPIPAAKRTCSRLDADAVICWLTVNTTMI